ncbi:MAG TPA: ester cyclase [Xanthobacteraceae bacterium]|nr:ester cyclase [Xanthobacteraceae bacterium]
MPRTPTELVERFYDVVWNNADEAEAKSLLDAAFDFRASLGLELQGPDRFIAYLRSVHAALANFTCKIEEIVAADDRVAARMGFHGIHRAKLFGVGPTGRQIRWSGAAFFKTRGDKITALWVLGDVDAVRRQLEPERHTQDFQL